MTVHTAHSNDQITISLGQEVNIPTVQKPPVREADKFVALQTFYLLNCFGVSDECYHEMTQVYIVNMAHYQCVIINHYTAESYLAMLILCEGNTQTAEL